MREKVILIEHNVDDMTMQVLGVPDRELMGLSIIEDVSGGGGLIILLVYVKLSNTGSVFDGVVAGPTLLVTVGSILFVVGFFLFFSSINSP